VYAPWNSGEGKNRALIPIPKNEIDCMQRHVHLTRFMNNAETMTSDSIIIGDVTRVIPVS
jgi:hypothetical protein